MSVPARPADQPATRTLWVVEVEAVMGPGASAVDIKDLERLLETLAPMDPQSPTPVALHSADRHAVQLAVHAPDMADAIAIAATRMRVAWQAEGVVGWELARVTGQTWEEYESELSTSGL